MLDKWHDFFIVLGAAAGTLIGAMFVVISIASGLVRESELTSRIFVTPTIFHLSFVLMGCAFTLVPSVDRVSLGAGAGVAGIVFLGYAGRNVYHIVRRRAVVWSDHLWYAIVPLLAYVLVIGGAVLVLKGGPGGLETLAMALALLVISGIRNAWDLILFFLERQAGGREDQSEGGAGPVA
ncbi:MAG TPA: hypothetical protein VG328_14935 [Stellaceae bacterium]|nr:hypothetical protein [Stellaceae bacterium]